MCIKGINLPDLGAGYRLYSIFNPDLVTIKNTFSGQILAPFPPKRTCPDRYGRTKSVISSEADALLSTLYYCDIWLKLPGPEKEKEKPPRLHFTMSMAK